MLPESAPLNQLTYSVSELSFALKRMVEDNFGYVRVRGELSGWKVATSGHAYMRLKDAQSLLDGVCWKGTVSRLPFRPEDGLEVVCTGKLTTYPGRSNYQIVVESMELAGAGALMALLEKRKTMLAAEGLFDAKRKRALPFMPLRIGVVTSPTGAVIRDILHRIADRFACHVLVWGVAVQGEGAAAQIAGAIEGFNRLPDDIRPQLLIVARGGGSLEDLWAFNEEIVVRAAASSVIPLISAVGHETDTTLIDYAADMRAPTPTAAAEIAVPVRDEWLLSVKENEKRLFSGIHRLMQYRHERLQSLARGLPNLLYTIDVATQRLDDWTERLHAALPAYIKRNSQQLHMYGARLQPQFLMQKLTRLTYEKDALAGALHYAMREHWQYHKTRFDTLLGRAPNPLHRIELAGQRLANTVLRMQPQAILQRIARMQYDTDAIILALHNITTRRVCDLQNHTQSQHALLESLNPKRVLERGFAIVQDKDGHVVARAAQCALTSPLKLVFCDGYVRVQVKEAEG